MIVFFVKLLLVFDNKSHLRTKANSLLFIFSEKLINSGLPI